MLRFCEWMKNLKFAHKIVIAGNHDGCTDAAFAGESMISTLDYLMFSCNYLQNEALVLAGLRIFGTPYTCWGLRNDGSRPAWAHGITRGIACSALCEGIPDCDILISHQ